ncbi:MAG: folate family ECF transporter S component [Clostridia bacterium]|nr:folate family ECF transporter S component [Clostridia bacterium]MBP3651757.1 folate family ECF transporter S component [Clostridia bacterium]
MKERPVPKKNMTTRALAYCALLAAISVVLARLIIPMPNVSTRFSIEAVPIYLAGMLFGPMAGGLVGFSADLVGCLFSGYGYNPIFCLPPILYGVFGGLFRHYLGKGVSIPKLVVGFLPPVVFGSILWQSAALSFVYNSKGSFTQSMIFFLSTRSIQFAVTLVLDVIIIALLFKSNIFRNLDVWPPKSSKSDTKV